MIERELRQVEIALLLDLVVTTGAMRLDEGPRARRQREGRGTQTTRGQQ